MILTTHSADFNAVRELKTRVALLEMLVEKFTKGCKEHEKVFEKRVCKLEKIGRNNTRDISDLQDNLEGDVERRLVKLEKKNLRGARKFVADQANDGLGDENIFDDSEENN